MIPLVMSIIAKTETFQRDMAKAGKSVNRFSTTSSRATATITKMGRSIMMMAGVGGGLYMLTRGIRGAISAGLEQEKVERQLTAAIGGNISGMKKYAAVMQTQTIYGDELILSQMAYGKNLGINTEQLEAATTAAIGLAAKYRLELNSAMMLVGRAALGQTQTLTRYGIVLDETLGPQEKFNALLKIGADNFHLAGAETENAAGALEQFRNNAGDIGEEISMGVLPAMTDMLTSINDNKEAWKEFFSTQISGLSEVMSGFKSVRTILEETSKMMESRGLVPPGKQRYGMWAPMPQTEAAREPKGLPVGKLDISPRGYQRLAEMNNRVLEMEREALSTAGAAPATPAGMTDEAMAASQRAERVMAVRVDAMKAYNDELKLDFAQTALYGKEKFTEAAKSIEGSMSSAFQSMIQGGANFRDAMNAFSVSIGNAFAKMAADMAARAMMNAVIGAAVGGMFGGTVGSFGRIRNSSYPGMPGTHMEPAALGAPTRHSGWVPDGVPSFQRGRMLKSSEMVAVIEKDELLAPNKQIARDVGGGGKDESQIKIIIVRDEKAAQIEAMNSKEGEKAYIRHAARNRNI